MKFAPWHQVVWATITSAGSLAGAFAAASVISHANLGPLHNDRLAEKIGDPARGRTFFVKSCARCHGNDGEGHGEDDDGPNLHDLRISNARIATVIRKGIKEEMPAFAKKYQIEDIACLVAYVRTLH
jgi:mono/diheme cytochrome c family protein